jgi:DNA-binding NarL/FixJ family response regulator
MLTSDSSERNVQAARQAGAIGYLLKENDGGTLSAAIIAAFNGEAVLDRSLAADRARNELSQSPSVKRRDPLYLLSHQERKVVALLSSGLTNREIGAQLGLTEKTVKNYLSAIFTKLNITRRTQAAALHVESLQER